MTQITLRRGTSSAWLSANPVLADGEAGLETDTGKLKFGNGSFQWSALGYFMPDHTHDASEIVTGEFASDRLPLSTASNRGALSPGNHLKLQNIEHRQITTPTGTAAPSTYAYGHSYFSIDGQTGWPFAYATVVTVRVNGINPRGTQTLVAKDTGTGHGQTWVRVELEGDTWSAWTTIRPDDGGKGVAFLNSWLNFAAGTYQAMRTARISEQVCTLVGMPKPGTITDGVAIATVNSAHIPNRDQYCSAIARTTVPSNVAIMVTIRGSANAFPGRVEVFGAPSTTSYLGLSISYHLKGD